MFLEFRAWLARIVFRLPTFWNSLGKPSHWDSGIRLKNYVSCETTLAMQCVGIAFRNAFGFFKATCRMAHGSHRMLPSTVALAHWLRGSLDKGPKMTQAAVASAKLLTEIQNERAESHARGEPVENVLCATSAPPQSALGLPGILCLGARVTDSSFSRDLAVSETSKLYTVAKEHLGIAKSRGQRSERCTFRGRVL